MAVAFVSRFERINDLRDIKRSKSIAISTWCEQTCHGFCERINNSYKCNCKINPGFEYSDTIKGCLPCRSANYGYGCKESCRHVPGKCNLNATHENESCTCNLGYQPPFCSRLIDQCAINSPCNNATEDCVTDPNNGIAICTCKLGYEREDIIGNCKDIDECEIKTDNCNSESSICSNTIGSDKCNCKSGYQFISGSCVDINESTNPASCANYNNAFCANTRGLYECRCSAGFSVGGMFIKALNSATGRCTCPLLIMNLVVSSDPAKHTCHCPGHPFVNYTGEKCIPLNSNSKLFNIESFSSSTLKAEISNTLHRMNKTCNEACLQINNISVPHVDIAYYTTLNISLNSTQRVQLVIDFYDYNISINSSYDVTIRIIINDLYGKLETFSSKPRRCEECIFLATGVCNLTEDACICIPGFEGKFCYDRAETTKPTTQSSSTTNWTITVVIISAIAGLMNSIIKVDILSYS
ncbi:unnamed protein product [Rotaria sp. Silwood2]|nr:unnamed protein product [Rotaria sp. Silwood2]